METNLARIVKHFYQFQDVVGFLWMQLVADVGPAITPGAGMPETAGCSGVGLEQETKLHLFCLLG